MLRQPVGPEQHQVVGHDGVARVQEFRDEDAADVTRAACHQYLFQRSDPFCVSPGKPPDGRQTSSRRGAVMVNPAATASRRNIRTVSRENSVRSLPSRESLAKRSLVTVMTWQPMASAWT